MSKLSDKIGGFVTIPTTVVKMLPAIGADAFTLFAYLRYRTNGESGLAFPSYETIRNDTRLHYRLIVKSIRTLEEHGLLVRHKQFSRATEYELQLPASPSTIGSTVLPPLVVQSFQCMQTNKTEFNKTENILSSTRSIQDAYQTTCGYPIDWKAGEASAAKWLSANGYSAVQVVECYNHLKAQVFWKDKRLSLASLVKQIGEYVKTHDDAPDVAFWNTHITNSRGEVVEIK